ADSAEYARCCSEPPAEAGADHCVCVGQEADRDAEGEGALFEAEAELAVAADGVAAEEDPGTDQRLHVGATARRQTQPEIERHSQRRRGIGDDEAAEASFHGHAAREPSFDGERQLEDPVPVEDVIAADPGPHLRRSSEGNQCRHRERCDRQPSVHAPPLYGARSRAEGTGGREYGPAFPTTSIDTIPACTELAARSCGSTSPDWARASPRSRTPTLRARCAYSAGSSCRLAMPSAAGSLRPWPIRSRSSFAARRTPCSPPRRCRTGRRSTPWPPASASTCAHASSAERC